jgi:hypothetical protein
MQKVKLTLETHLNFVKWAVKKEEVCISAITLSKSDSGGGGYSV